MHLKNRRSDNGKLSTAENNFSDQLSECAKNLQSYVNKMQDQQLNEYLCQATELMFRASEKFENMSMIDELINLKRGQTPAGVMMGYGYHM